MKQIAVAEGLFTLRAEGPRLTGSRCGGCQTPYFPKTPVCHNPDCDHSQMADADFGPRGRIWSVATQDYPPPSPIKFDKPYTPYAMAVVDMTEGLRVLGRVEVEDPKSVEVGMEVELILAPLCHDDDGNEVICWKFRLLGGQA